MAFIGIVHLAERLLNQSSTGGHDQNVTQKQMKKASSAQSAQEEDQFTPSPPNEVDTGLFQVTQYNLFSAAADFLLAQSAPPIAEQIAAPPTATVLSEAPAQPASQTAPPAAPQAKAATA